MKTFMTKSIKSFCSGQDGRTPEIEKNSRERSSLSPASIKTAGDGLTPCSLFPVPTPISNCQLPIAP